MLENDNSVTDAKTRWNDFSHAPTVQWSGLLTKLLQQTIVPMIIVATRVDDAHDRIRTIVPNESPVVATILSAPLQRRPQYHRTIGRLTLPWTDRGKSPQSGRAAWVVVATVAISTICSNGSRIIGTSTSTTRKQRLGPLLRQQQLATKKSYSVLVRNIRTSSCYTVTGGRSGVDHVVLTTARGSRRKHRVRPKSRMP
jgi:hypothetical protein